VGRDEFVFEVAINTTDKVSFAAAIRQLKLLM
jgi:hypothetical protein